jgi:hypothetical protein
MKSKADCFSFLPLDDPPVVSEPAYHTASWRVSTTGKKMGRRNRCSDAPAASDDESLRAQDEGVACFARSYRPSPVNLPEGRDFIVLSRAAETVAPGFSRFKIVKKNRRPTRRRRRTRLNATLNYANRDSAIRPVASRRRIPCAAHTLSICVLLIGASRLSNASTRGNYTTKIQLV